MDKLDQLLNLLEARKLLRRSYQLIEIAERHALKDGNINLLLEIRDHRREVVYLWQDIENDISNIDF